MVRDFQESRGFTGRDLDGKLGPGTLRALGAAFPEALPEVLLRIGDLELPRAVEPVTPRSADKIIAESGSGDRKAVARLWNHYGAAVVEGAATAGIDPAVALAIFAVESKRAYDPTTGLVIVRFA